MTGVYECRVVAAGKLNSAICAMTIANGALAAEARAGQFLHVKCGEAQLLRRPISICRVSGDSLELVFEIKGKGTQWLSKRIPGMRLDVIGPLGNGFVLPEGRIIIVGGGIGTPPLLFAAGSARGGATAVLGFRSKDRIILEDEFAAVCDGVYITTDDGSFGIAGPVTVPLVKLLEHGKHGAVLACGPRAMLSAVAKLCSLYGIPCQVSLEERMGCGVGACLVCACETVSENGEQMRRVCKDGPVFDAKEIVW